MFSENVLVSIVLLVAFSGTTGVYWKQNPHPFMKIGLFKSLSILTASAEKKFQGKTCAALCNKIYLMRELNKQYVVYFIYTIAFVLNMVFIALLILGLIGYLVAVRPEVPWTREWADQLTRCIMLVLMVPGLSGFFVISLIVFLTKNRAMAIYRNLQG